MKTKKLMRRSLSEGAILMSIIALLGGIIWFFSDMVEDAQRQKNLVTNQVAVLDNQLQALKAKLGKFSSNEENYRKLLSTEGAAEFLLDRKALQPIFAELQKQFIVEKFLIEIDPAQDRKEAELKKQKVAAIASDGHLSFDSFSDIEAVRYLENLQKRLPALMKITSIKMSRNAPVSNGKDQVSPDALGVGDKPSLNTDIRFQWLGFKNLTPPSAIAPGMPPAGMPGKMP